jgi:hypothetical protein
MCSVLVVVWSFLLVPLFAAEPKLPKINAIAPFGITPGVATRLTIRGVRIEDATEVRCQEPKSRVKLLTKRKAEAPKEKGKGGNESRLEVEVTLPADYPNRTVTLTVLTPAGESPASLLLVDRSPVVAEKEPNDGFRRAQPIQLPQEVNGSIGAAKDVDLYRFEGKAGQQVAIEVFANRYGSPLDSLLTLYDGKGRILAACDDMSNSSDSRLDVRLPQTGTYYVGVIDANDAGSANHVYRLSVRLTKP